MWGKARAGRALYGLLGVNLKGKCCAGKGMAAGGEAGEGGAERGRPGTESAPQGADKAKAPEPRL